MKIAIAGYGFVGRAYVAVLQNHYETEIIDPKHYDKKVSPDVDGVIICVSTPEGNNGSCNMRHVSEVMRDCPDVPILIKSTISIEGWDHLTSFYAKRMSYSPEFLRANTALEDLKQQEYIMIGGAEVAFWTKLFKKIFPSCSHIIVAEPKELILIKYFRNAYLATKVSFFNQIYDLCKASGMDFERIRKSIALDKRIGTSHTQVTKERGFGGHCFPKDIKAIKQSALYYGIDLSIIKEILNYNNKVRDEANKERK
tara:strand:+ start:1104 stop:1868 length:765 start_codon:yes stop_codon:yes gene_type:complete